MSTSADDSEARSAPIDVVAARLVDDRGRVLVARRAAGKAHAGQWEFPGGKIEPGESPADALGRELDEELGIRASAIRPRCAILHRGEAGAIRLWLHDVAGFEGTPEAHEHDEIRWEAPDRLADLELPPADRVLARALDVEPHYAISRSPSEYPSQTAFLAAWSACLDRGYRLLRLRLGPREWLDDAVVEALAAMTREAGARWLASGNPAICREWPADGLHVTSRQLVALSSRPVPRDRLLAASCHDLEEIRMAHDIGADFVTLSPVQPTRSHPGAEPLGWDDFARVVRFSPLPVMALGGVSPSDAIRAREAGALGVAGIRAFGWA
ncbi:MAG: Nudix family hydrolase [Wenzhouxiangellaceae bacterium]|nr:Nudix family hydrolase [Wenzhouxiangellaceae bacterium]